MERSVGPDDGTELLAWRLDGWNLAAELLDLPRAGARLWAIAGWGAWAGVRRVAAEDGFPVRSAAGAGKLVGPARDVPEQVWEFPKQPKAAELPDAAAPCKQGGGRFEERSCAASAVAVPGVALAASQQLAAPAQSEY